MASTFFSRLQGIGRFCDKRAAFLPLAFGLFGAVTSIASTSVSSNSYCDSNNNNSINNNSNDKNKARILHLKKEIDKIYTDYCTANHIPGCIYGIVHDGELLISSAIGLREPYTSKLVSEGTRFRIASMSKSFTSMAILHLRDKGLLNLDDPVEMHITELRKSSSSSKNKNSPVLTIRHLLSMQGGLPQDDPWADRLLAQSTDEFRAYLLNGISQANDVGLEFEYSNLGYAMLGLIITNVANMPYQQYIRDNILVPLGMLDTTYEYTDVDKSLFAPGFRYEDGVWKPEPLLHDGSYGAMGGLITTISDFAKYLAFHQSASSSNKKLISGVDGSTSGPIAPASLKEMHLPWTFVGLYPDTISGDSSKANPKVSAYGYGLSWNKDARDVVVLRHAGGLPGYGSEFRFLPGYNLGIISFANRTYAPMTTANNNVMEFLLAKKAVTRDKPVASELLNRRAKQLFDLLSRNFDQIENEPIRSVKKEGEEVSDEVGLGIFADNFFLDKPLRLWKIDAKTHFDKVIPIALRTGAAPNVKMINNLRGSFDIKGEKGDSITVFFTMSPEKNPKIQEVRIKYNGFEE